VERIGSYQVGSRLGGEARELYEAVHCVLPRRALIKVASSDGALALLREACILEALDHPGIVRVFESGRLADGRPWFAYERVEGFPLARGLARRLEPGDVAELVRDLADALGHAHRRGVVHGGLRPDRIVLTGHPRRFPMCLVDWSDARAHDAGRIARKAAAPDPHEAPELVRGDAIDDRADVFAIGVIAYEALTGELAEGGTLSAASGRPEAPRALTALIDQMLAFDRWDRPSCAELCQALDVYAAADAPAATPYIRKPKWTPPLKIRERELEALERDEDTIERGRD
jgi:serine/threonine protein kinase